MTFWKNLRLDPRKVFALAFEMGLLINSSVLHFQCSHKFSLILINHFVWQVLDKNFELGNIILPVSMALLQYCASPQRYASDYQPPNYTLWYLEPHTRQSWLSALLVILYKVRSCLCFGLFIMSVHPCQTYVCDNRVCHLLVIAFSARWLSVLWTDFRLW